MNGADVVEMITRVFGGQTHSDGHNVSWIVKNVLSVTILGKTIPHPSVHFSSLLDYVNMEDTWDHNFQIPETVTYADLIYIRVKINTLENVLEIDISGKDVDNEIYGSVPVVDVRMESMAWLENKLTKMFEPVLAYQPPQKIPRPRAVRPRITVDMVQTVIRENAETIQQHYLGFLTSTYDGLIRDRLRDRHMKPAGIDSMRDRGVQCLDSFIQLPESRPTANVDELTTFFSNVGGTMGQKRGRF